jgi:serine protease Do
VVKPTRESTVRILCDDKESVLGTVVGPEGWILTKASELTGKLVCQLWDGRKLPARVVGVQDVYDLAMLKIETKGLRPVEWRESQLAPVGNWLATPGLGENPLAVGIVSVGARKNPGKLGAPLETSKRGYLGVLLEAADEGLKIGSVQPGTPAEKAGLKKDDLVLSLAGQPVREVEAFSSLVQSYHAGDVVVVRVRRGEQEKDIKVTLAPRPPNSNRMDVQNRMGGDLSKRRSGFPVHLQHDTILKPKDCGGPLVDLDGKAIGINIARAGRTETLALPSEAVLPLLAELKSGKLAAKEVTVPRVIGKKPQAKGN